MNCFLALLQLFMQAAAALPFIAALALIGGRRGNAQLCIAGSLGLLSFGLFCSAAGPLWLLLSYFQQVLPYHASLEQMLAPLFQPAGFAWSLSLVAWLAGWLAELLAALIAHRTLSALQQDRYVLKFVYGPMFTAFLAAMFFFCSFLLQIWPFAGLPEGMEWDRAAMAIWRHATRSYFLSLCPAGAFALAFFQFQQGRFPGHAAFIATRWLSFWAFAGALPTVVTGWGTNLGASMGGTGMTVPGVSIQIYSLTCFTLALFCWAFLLWRPRYSRFLSLPAACLLLLKTCLPFMIGHL